ncbi:MAG TPA: hypothetical protein VNC50_18620 [Planctomycetia bacterium]|nr:hypothetical protein [Planctomycetia bacterium]
MTAISPSSGREPYFDALRLAQWAALAGSLVGLADGLGRIHDWRRRGALDLLADCTWGLAGASLGVLVHAFNLPRGVPFEAGRRGAHRYVQGFAFHPRFAVTLGACCSNLRDWVETDLFIHERTHVRQNRLFGPLFTFTYVGWMIVFFPVGIVAGLAARNTGAGIMRWCYVNNPWEEWAYRTGGYRDPAQIWPFRRFLVTAIPVLFAALLFVAWVVYRGWFAK